MKPEQQAILARDMIQMIHEYRDNADVLEYLESFAHAIARGIEDDTIVSWDDLAGICDQRYYSLKQNDPIPLNEELLDNCARQIKKYIPSV